MIILIIACILLFLSLASAIFFLIRLINKVEYYENWILQFKERMLEAHDTMKKIDLHGSFEADDEVGDVFKTMQSIVDDLNNFVE